MDTIKSRQQAAKARRIVAERMYVGSGMEGTAELIRELADTVDVLSADLDDLARYRDQGFIAMRDAMNQSALLRQKWYEAEARAERAEAR